MPTEAARTPSGPPEPSPPARVDTAEVRRILRSDGGRVTFARVKVLEALADAGEHLSAQQIHERVSQLTPSLNVSTVYRTLTRLEELELVHSVPAPGQTLYGLTTLPHHHAMCTECGTVTDLELTVVRDVMARFEQVTGFGFDEGSSLTVRAVCVRCRGQHDEEF